MSHFFANLVSLPLPRALRRRVRRALVQFRLQDWFAFRRFEREIVRDNAVLLVEANDCHGEVIGGYLEYFRDLGYAVDMLVNCRILAENPFCRLDLSDVGIWSCYFGAFDWFFGGRRIGGYRHVVLMSSAGYRFVDGSDAASIVRHYPALSRLRSLLVVEHELRDVDRFGERRLVEDGRVITLGRFGIGTFVCPILFGPAKSHALGRVTTFVTVGSVNAARKNHAALVDAATRLAAEGIPFRVVVIGAGSEEAFPEGVRDHFEVTGRLDYRQMFEKVEEADFFLPLLDGSNPDHDRYVTSGVTGSAQLIYAFGKVPVIDPHFAPFYGFDNGNAILSADLASGMRQAAGMGADEYARRRQGVEDLAFELKELSRTNLRNCLAGGERRAPVLSDALVERLRHHVSTELGGNCTVLQASFSQGTSSYCFCGVMSDGRRFFLKVGGAPLVGRMRAVVGRCAGLKFVPAILDRGDSDIDGHHVLITECASGYGVPDPCLLTDLQFRSLVEGYAKLSDRFEGLTGICRDQRLVGRPAQTAAVVRDWFAKNPLRRLLGRRLLGAAAAAEHLERALTRVIHGDFSWDNFLFDRNGLSAVFDFDLLTHGIPAEDLVCYFAPRFRDSSVRGRQRRLLSRRFREMVKTLPWQEVDWQDAVTVYRLDHAAKAMAKPDFGLGKALRLLRQDRGLARMHGLAHGALAKKVR